MSALFAVIFLAAIVGIFKPYIPNSKRSHFLVAAIVSFVLVGVFVPKADEKTTSAGLSAPAGVSKAVPIPDTPKAGSSDVAPAELESQWSYSEDRDEMRGSISKFASIRSDNEVDLDFPYGSVNGAITVRRRPKDGLSLMFSVDKGQILCRNFGDDTFISVKFDDGPVKRFACSGTSDGSSETAFIGNEKAFLTSLQKAKKTIIEAEFYQKGNQQFTFRTVGLKWD